MEPEPQILSLQEVGEQFFENEQELSSKIYIENGQIIINIEYEYCIDLSRCDTNDKILSWVSHLCEKTWMTLPVLERFISMAQAEHNLTRLDP